MPKAVLSPKQFALIVYIYLLGNSMIFLPEMLFAEKDTWISTLLGTLFGVLLLAVWLRLQQRYPDLTLFQYGIKILGPWLGYPLGFCLIFLMFIVSSFVVETMVIFTHSIMLPNTPEMVIEISFILVVVYACYKGIEAIGRMCELVWLPLTLLILVLPLLEWKEIGVQVFLPLFKINWRGVFTGAFSSFMFPFAEVLAPVVLLPYVKAEKKAQRYYLLAPLAAGILMLIRTMLALMVLGPELTNRMPMPVIALFRIIELGEFLNRVEGAFLGFWYMGLLMKLVITLYAAVLGLAQLTMVRRLENLWVPFAATLFFASDIRFPTFAEFHFSYFNLFPLLALPFKVLYPCLLLLVSGLRNKSKPTSVDQVDKGHNQSG